MFGVRKRDVEGGQVYHRAEFVDFAMTADLKGGIDFNLEKINLQIQNQGDGIKFNVDTDMLEQLQNAPGFTPTIISIQPLQNLSVFLGANDSDEIEQLSMR